VPKEWTCQSSRYGDGKFCDCGCGALDPDCSDERVESCDVCLIIGSCGHAPCPSNVLADDNAHCATEPGWLCGAASYGDGVCDCGCGALDIDCASQNAEACEACPVDGCASLFDCSTIEPEDNTVCTSAPRSWTCDARLYGDGSRCDCGCGFRDPDCATSDVSACDSCNDQGACSHQECPGTIDPDVNVRCARPAPPSTWTCDARLYADTKSCECGCGAQDPDCPDNEPASCTTCACGSHCPASVDPTDPTKCATPPAGWTCAPEAYSDLQCDCGCGVVDLECIPYNYCIHCHGCSGGDCSKIDANDTTKCIP
jgi:hypothetical protein